MNIVELNQLIEGAWKKTNHIGIVLHYTLGGGTFNIFGNYNRPEDVESIIINLEIPEGPRSFQCEFLKEALKNQDLDQFIYGFEDRFYLKKEFLKKNMEFISNVPWLRELHRSAFVKETVSHENDDPFRSLEIDFDRVKHKNRLAILFHRDYKTLEQRLEEQTFMLSKVKNGRDMKFSEKDMSCGSAFSLKIKEKTYFITAKHVVSGFGGSSVELSNPHTDNIYCKTASEKSSYDIEILDSSALNYTGSAFSLGNVGHCALTDMVYVCGYPGKLGAKPTVSVGHISKLNADFDGSSGLIQISSAAVNPQNSGGPVTDYQGNVIGVLVMRPEKKEMLQNIAFVEPIDRVLKEKGLL